jgi:hypothetical protein
MNRVAADLPAAPQLILIRSPGPAFGPGLARPRYRFRLEARALGAALQTLAVDDKRASRATPESLSQIAQSSTLWPADAECCLAWEAGAREPGSRPPCRGGSCLRVLPCDSTPISALVQAGDRE